MLFDKTIRSAGHHYVVCYLKFHIYSDVLEKVMKIYLPRMHADLAFKINGNSLVIEGESGVNTIFTLNKSEDLIKEIPDEFGNYKFRFSVMDFNNPSAHEILFEDGLFCIEVGDEVSRDVYLRLKEFRTDKCRSGINYFRDMDKTFSELVSYEYKNTVHIRTWKHVRGISNTTIWLCGLFFYARIGT